MLLVSKIAAPNCLVTLKILVREPNFCTFNK